MCPTSIHHYTSNKNIEVKNRTLSNSRLDNRSKKKIKIENNSSSNDLKYSIEDNDTIFDDFKTICFTLPTKYTTTNRLELETMKDLLAKGLDPNYILPDGQPLLTFIINKATSNQWVEMVKLLLERGASPHVRDKLGSPLLLLLVASGDLSLIRLAIKIGADIRLRGSDGETPLLSSVHYRHIDILKYLLIEGANPNDCSDDGNNAIMWALTRQNGLGRQRIIPCIQVLLEYGAEANFINPRGETPLMAATLVGESKLIGLLIEHGADPNIKNRNGETALHIAVKYEQEGIVSHLLKHGANPNIQDKLGRVPLMEAPSESILHNLLKHKANPNITDSIGNTSLHFHAKNGSSEFCYVLLEYKALKDPLNKAGDTPLQLAVRCRSQETIHILLQKGCNAGSVNASGVSIIQDAILPYDFYNTMNIFPKLNTRELMQELLDYTTETTSLVRQLLQQKGAADHGDEQAVTPLMLAAAIGNGCLTDILLSSGATVNATDGWGRSALTYACKWGHKKVVNVLLMNGSLVNTIDESGNLPVYYAAYYEHTHVILMLMIELAFFYVSYNVPLAKVIECNNDIRDNDKEQMSSYSPKSILIVSEIEICEASQNKSAKNINKNQEKTTNAAINKVSLVSQNSNIKKGTTNQFSGDNGISKNASDKISTPKCTKVDLSTKSCNEKISNSTKNEKKIPIIKTKKTMTENPLENVSDNKNSTPTYKKKTEKNIKTNKDNSNLCVNNKENIISKSSKSEFNSQKISIRKYDSAQELSIRKSNEEKQPTQVQCSNIFIKTNMLVTKRDGLKKVSYENNNQRCDILQELSVLHVKRQSDVLQGKTKTSYIRGEVVLKKVSRKEPAPKFNPNDEQLESKPKRKIGSLISFWENKNK